MTFVKSTLLAAAATLAIGSAAQAADAIGIPAPVVPVAPVASPAFDWSGFYAGARVGGLNSAFYDETNWLVGAEIGVNAQWDMFVLGAELAVDAVFADAETYAHGEITARAGVAFSQFLLYGTVGYSTDFDAPATVSVGEHILAGVGAEFAVSDSISIDGRYVYGWEQDSLDAEIHKFTIGANFHF